MQRIYQPLAAVLCLAAAAQSGCVALALTGAASGIEYTVTNVAYRTFTSPEKKVHAAAVRALKKMGISLDVEDEIDGGHFLKGETPDLTITVEVKSVTNKATKVSVDARKNLIIKDKAVAVEIISQIEKALANR